MSFWMDGFVSDDGQLFRRTMGETLAQMVRRRWPHHTAKQVARAWDLDPTTAANLTKGHASERTLTKAIRAEGWSLLEALGQALTGQTHAEWEEERLNLIIEQANHAKESIRRLRTRAAILAESAGELDPGGLLDSGSGPSPGGRREGRKASSTGSR